MMNARISAPPLTPAVFHILLALADGGKHGYAIMKRVETESQGKVRMGPGTLYGSLMRMSAAGLIEEIEDADDERRRFYRLTNLGQGSLLIELARLEQVVAIAKKKRIQVPEWVRSE